MKGGCSKWFVVVRCLFFFFQAEDGIRDYKVTGVQTCALPILLIGLSLLLEGFDHHIPKGYIYFAMGFSVFVEMINLRLRKSRPVDLHERYTTDRSEERRVGEEGEREGGRDT